LIRWLEIPNLAAMIFHDALTAELERRVARNPRYSLRAFARDLRTHHGTLSRVLDGRLRVTPRMIRRIGPLLDLNDTRIEEACVAANAARLARFIRDERFVADSRRLAVLTGMPIDDVNTALHQLLFDRRITMTTANRWEFQPT